MNAIYKIFKKIQYVLLGWHIQSLHQKLDDLNPSIANEAIRQLRAIDDERVVMPLAVLLHTSGASWRRRKAAWALGEIGGTRVVTPLLQVVHDADVEIRRQVVASLGKQSAPHIIEPLITALRDDDATVCEYAAAALGTRADSRAGRVAKLCLT